MSTSKLNTQLLLQSITVLFLIAISIMAFSSLFTASAVTQGEPPCDNPEVTVALEAKNTKFNVTEIKVPKDTCIKIVLVNKDDIEHDITIDPHPDDGFDGINLDVGPLQTNSTTFRTPNKDVTYDFYCEIPGHRGQGMEGKFIVGKGNSSSAPGFEVSLSFIGIMGLAAVTLAMKQRKR